MLDRKCMVLKAVLLLRKVNRYQSKDEQVAEVTEWEKQGFESEDAYYDDMANRDLEFEQRYGGYEDCYTPSATSRDYGPSNPWDAPGMSISDFI